ncbi:MAG: ftsH 1, partial [Deltaproteobacteria bacterium]|nr:ftsH 1 [Deltaproteobacteria bacterium]
MAEDDEKNPNELFKKKIKSFFSPPDPQKKKGALPPKAHFSIWYFLIIFLLISVVQNYFLAPRVENIPYSKFKQALVEGQVNNLVIGPDKINGKLKGKGDQGEQDFVTIRVEDPNLIKELDERKVSYSGLYESKLLANILSWVIPLAIFFFIWRYAMKRMGPGYGVMSFSKSKAKVFAESETKVTFADVAGIDEAKEELLEVVEFLKNPGKFQKLGGRIPKGVLLLGPPATAL